MTGRRAIVGLCMLCALVFSAFAAQSASALGTTAYTCKEEATPTHKFKDAHCKEESAGGNTGKFEHVSFTGETELEGTNKTTGTETSTAKLKTTVAGVVTELQATGVSGSGHMSNSEVGGEMVASGTGTITYTGVTVTKPAGKGCKVFADPGGTEMGNEKEVVTEPLQATTAGQGMFLNFTPQAGTVFAKFWITGCEEPVAFLNGTHTVTGSAKGVPTGATTVFTHAETTASLTLDGGPAAGIDGSLTLKGRLNSSQAFTALSATT